MMYFVRTFLISLCVLKALGLLLSKRFEIKEKLYTPNTFLKLAGGRMHIDPHPTPRGHKLQKPSKESGIF